MKRVIQWSLMTALCLWGFFSFLILAGEEAPDSPYTFGQFMLIKSAAIVNLVGWKSHATLTLLATQDCPLWLQYD